jgi:hypothetical protein
MCGVKETKRGKIVGIKLESNGKFLYTDFDEEFPERYPVKICKKCQRSGPCHRDYGGIQALKKAYISKLTELGLTYGDTIQDFYELIND